MELDSRFHGKNVLFGLSGGIACYKAVEVLRGLQREGANLQVVMTRMATKFVGTETFRALTDKPVLVEFGGMEHIIAPHSSDLFIVAPATANVIGKFASGIADDLLSTMFLAATCPKVIVPSMNTAMWENPAVRRNIKTLKGWGISIVEPEEGELACGEYGQGRFPSLEKIIFFCEKNLCTQDFSGKKVVVTAGATREFIDDVRFISNPSSGKMGFMIAREASLRGAETVLIAGSGDFDVPEVKLTRVTSADDMFEASLRESSDADVFIGASAVSDFKPAKRFEGKIKKERSDKLSIELAKTPDIISEVSKRRKEGMKIVGFALESEKSPRLSLKNAKKKLTDKVLDLIVLNSPESFSSEKIEAVIIDKRRADNIGMIGKRYLARYLLDRVAGMVDGA